MKLNRINIKNYFSAIKEFFTNKKYKIFYYNFILSILCLFAFFTPDYILKIAGASRVKFELSFFIAFLLFGFVMSLIKNKKVFLSVIIVFFCFEMIQLHYMAYFGQPITALEIKKIFTEAHDTAQSGFKYFFIVWYIFPTMLITYGIYIYSWFKYNNKTIKHKIAYIALIIILLVKHERAYRKTLKHFLPGPTRNSIHNTLNTFSYFFVKELWNKTVSKDIPFKEYIIEKNNNKSPDIVIMLIGESMNYQNMSLYGYQRQTTPNLDKLKNNNNFIYRKALSSSVSTSSSLPFLLNVIREAGNLKLLRSKNTNLFNLAKQNNYSTYLFTAQESKILNDLGVNYCDLTIAKDNDPLLFNNMGDEGLFTYFHKVLNKKENKQFIVMFQRNLHSPYELNYENHKDKFEKYNINANTRQEKMTNRYDNSMLYQDYIINKLIQDINNIKDKSILLIITGDHGQMLGEDNLYGHNILDNRVAQVPFMVYYHNYQPHINFSILPETLSHYEISKIIANILGYNIINPNEDGFYFIQGNNIYSDNFIIPYNRENNKIKFHRVDSIYNKYRDKIENN